MVRAIMHGCNGAMGQVISGIAAKDEEISIVAGIDMRTEQKNDYPVFASLNECKVEADVVIDFSNAAAVDELLDWCAEKKMPVVLCTTGLSEVQLAKVEETAEKTAVLRSANMSLGINTLLKLLQDAGYELPGDVTITSVCDEEGGGNGSIQAVMRGLKADGVVNCEPTDDTLILAHMGWVFFKVDFEGKACHSGAKAEGVSAIEKAIKVIQGLNEMEHRWLLTIRHRLLPPPSLNIGVIEGGTAGSTVPGECSFSTCVHYVPTLMNQDMVVKEFTEVVERISRSDAWMEAHPPKISIYQTGHGFEMEEDHPLVDTFKEAYSEALSRSVKVEGSHFGCDSRLWRNIAGCPTIQYGPGEGAQCHTVDEWLKLDSYLEAILVYAKLILSWGEKK